MHKKIVALGLSTVSAFTFSMEQPGVTLESVINQSAFQYNGKYGSGHKEIILPGEKVDLQDRLFNFLPDQQFPFSTEIKFKNLPVNTPEGLRLKVLNLIMTEGFILRARNHDLFKETQYNLDNNKKYILHVIINSNNELSYVLEEKKN